MFDRIQGFLNTLFMDLQETMIMLFVIGFLVLSLLKWTADDENEHKFQKGIKGMIWGIILFVLAKPAVLYIQGNL